MTPQLLLTFVAVFAVARIALVVQRVAAGGTRTRSLTVAREWLDTFIFAGLGAWLLITFVGRTYYIPSGSMIPTLEVHDVLLVDKVEFRFRQPRYGDIVVFPPPIPSPDDFIKRVIGVPGDTLRIKNGIVYRNGVALAEDYINQKPQYDMEIRDYGIWVNDGFGWHKVDPADGNIPPKSMWTAPNRIPANCYFMMGDNRNDSVDSHMWGFAQDTGTFATGPLAGKPAWFTGRAFTIFWPISHAHLL